VTQSILTVAATTLAHVFLQRKPKRMNCRIHETESFQTAKVTFKVTKGHR